MPVVKLGAAHLHPTICDHAEPSEYIWAVDDIPVEEGGYTHDTHGHAYGVEERPNGKDALLHVLQNDVTRLPGHECFTSIVRDFPQHSPKAATWVWSDNDDLALMLSEAYGCPIGRPDDVEMTHHTLSGPPGVGPAEDSEG